VEVKAEVNSFNDFVGGGALASEVVCTMGMQIVALRNLYPNVKFVQYESYSLLEMDTQAGKCKGSVLDMATIGMWLNDKQNCPIQEVGQPIVFKSNSWVTNQKSKCLGAAVDVAIEKSRDGILQQLWRDHIPPANCPVSTEMASMQLSTGNMAGMLGFFLAVSLLLCVWRNVHDSMKTLRDSTSGVRDDAISTQEGPEDEQDELERLRELRILIAEFNQGRSHDPLNADGLGGTPEPDKVVNVISASAGLGNPPYNHDDVLQVEVHAAPGSLSSTS